MEKCAPNSNEKCILDAFEDAITHFGKENIGDLIFVIKDISHLK
jgi:hypothetical protein